MSYLLPLTSEQRVSVGTLEIIYAAQGRREEFVRDVFRLFDLLDRDDLWRPLWLLRACARDNRIHANHLTQLAGHLDEFTHWISRLTLCQLLAHTGCPAALRDDVYPVLADCFSDRRVIIRAWALSALMHFDEPRFQKPVATMLRAAHKDPAKAMQARLRNLALAKRKAASTRPLSP
jgi:hypothetical protein